MIIYPSLVAAVAAARYNNIIIIPVTINFIILISLISIE